MRIRVPFVAALFGSALICLFGMIGWVVSSLPEKSVEQTVTGVSGTVSITFDENGIPAISASTIDDAAFGMGFIHARDRLWQMETMRRYGSGRLSELTGSRTLHLDRFSRTLGFYQGAKESFERLPVPVKRHLFAYSKGVNAWITNNRDALPPEFLLLRHEPEPWEPADSLVWGKLMGLELSGNFRDEILRASLAERGLDKYFDTLWPDYSLDAPVERFGGHITYKNLLPGIIKLSKVLPELSGQPFGASNVWATAGSRNHSGLPLLANDPHLNFSAPILWYLAEVKIPDLTIRGATVPGVPYVIVGQNDHVAWGFTATQADLQDVFFEQSLDQSGMSYMGASGPERYRLREEVIKVKGAADETLVIRSSNHGPIISDLLAGSRVFGRKYRKKLEASLSATFLQARDTTPQAIYRLNQAKRLDDVLAALSKVSSPMLNVMFADKRGNIGFKASGWIPNRKKGTGFLSSPGWTGEYDWNGYIPFDVLPNSINPPGEVLINANNKIVSKSYPHFISRDWAEPYRAGRLRTLLASKKKLSLFDFKNFQSDHVSEMALDMLSILKAMTDWNDIPPVIGAVISTWDGQMTREGPAPLIFWAWFHELIIGIFKDELGSLFDEYANYRPSAAKKAILTDPRWCDVITTRPIETCNNVVTDALKRAILKITEETRETEATKWKWGDFHKAVFRHPILGHVPILSLLVNLEIPSDGGNFTVNRGSTRFSGKELDFAHIHGSGYRGLYDLENPDNSHFIIATGQSGNFLSRHYRNLLRPWRDGKYVSIGSRKKNVRYQSIKLEPMH